MHFINIIKFCSIAQTKERTKTYIKYMGHLKNYCDKQKNEYNINSVLHV